MKRHCEVCGEEIHPRRLKILPGTTTCVAHSREQALSCYPIITGKTGNTIEICHPDVAEAMNRKMQRHGQSPNQGMKGKA